MIYSIVPYDNIFYNAEDKDERMEVTLNGEKIVLLKNSDNTFTIERLISTNPKAYLKPELSPGTLLMTVAVNNKSSGVTWKIMDMD